MKVKSQIGIKNIVKRIIDDEVPALASELSYSLILSFFPFLIFLMTLIGYLSLDTELVLLQLSKILPDGAYKLVHDTVLEVLQGKNSKLLSLGFIFSMWTASTGFRGVIRGLNKAYDEKEKRSLVKVIIISILCTIGLTFIIVVTLLLLVFGELLGYFLIKKFSIPESFMSLWNIVRYAIILTSMIFVFALLYRYTPSKRLRWKEVIPGAIFATIGWIVVSIGFSFYVNNFANYSRLYGSIGAVIVLLTWLYLTSITIMIGGELNAALAFDRKVKRAQMS
ncbi:YihY/virulence factor BrkB family protein [Clostridium peptidivorans]|uniref:YihY/virulence factor BrkB family protein n=1 Tax=Clostridium peptidivorans TaxID=100174 RepID=UPI000BE3A2CF|nr:YihY/virulence factor BrkB family protein [Clostridium peptidivorans]